MKIQFSSPDPFFVIHPDKAVGHGLLVGFNKDSYVGIAPLDETGDPDESKAFCLSWPAAQQLCQLIHQHLPDGKFFLAGQGEPKE